MSYLALSDSFEYLCYVFLICLLAGWIANEICVQTSIFANVWSQINKINMSNFHPLEVVCRGSETQVQVGENLNQIGLI